MTAAVAAAMTIVVAAAVVTRAAVAATAATDTKRYLNTTIWILHESACALRVLN
jgi:hypothetical protein